MTTQEKLDNQIDNALHPERNGLLVKEGIAEGASHEWLVKREIKKLIDSAKREAELEWQIDQTTELARQNFMYRCLYGEAPLEYKGVNTLIAYQTYREGDDFRKNFARYVEQLAALLEQSEESI